MANPFETEPEELLEGLLCPVCHTDLKSIARLQTHYEEEHSEEDRDTLQSIKDLIGKAKRKFLKVEDDASIDISPDEGFYAKGLDPAQWENQEDGHSVSHTSAFKAIRNNRTDRFVFETNRLLLRLDKLLSETSQDPVKRKANEKSVVIWAPDEDVPLCPSCAKRFNLAKRKHHCRLCGSIMCASCSEFLTHSFARRLTWSSNAKQISNFQDANGSARADQSPASHTLSPIASISRSSSATSLNSLINSSGEPHIRVCIQCKTLLDQRDQNLQLQATKPVIVNFYERLKSCMDEAGSLCSVYLKMVDSLMMGETTYAVQDASDVRTKLIRMAETIDSLSKKVQALGTKDDPPTPHKQMMLQQGIYMSANTFLKETMLGIPSVPSAAALDEIRENRKQDFERQLAEERRLEGEMQKKMALRYRETSPRKEYAGQRPRHLANRDSSVSTDLGWGPETVEASQMYKGAGNDDPIVQQMNIIRNYIKQARQVHKYEEVKMLENNLKELQAELWRNSNSEPN